MLLRVISLIIGAAAPSGSSLNPPLSFVSLIPPSSSVGPAGTLATSVASPPATVMSAAPSFSYPFMLASSFPPIPAKLVAKIKSLQFVELKELLPDNIAALDQNASLARPHDQLPKQREVSSILTWVSAFTTYTAIVSEAHPSRTKELLAYMRLMVREARRSNNKGWLCYDRIFRQNAAANPSLSWANLDPSLHSSFCLGSEPPPMVCSLCNELDHKTEDCALSVPAPNQPFPPKTPPARATHSSKQRPARAKFCLSWNSGQCMLPGTCEYLHECHTCHEDHRAKDCDLTPPDSVFKRPKRQKLSKP